VSIAPASNSKKSVMISWLNEEEILYTEEIPKPDLYQLLKINKANNALTKLTVLWQNTMQKVRTTAVLLSRTQPFLVDFGQRLGIVLLRKMSPSRCMLLNLLMMLLSQNKTGNISVVMCETLRTSTSVIEVLQMKGRQGIIPVTAVVTVQVVQTGEEPDRLNVVTRN
jgi:hypothetical protein